MKRLRSVKKYGNSWVIALYKADVEDFELDEGDEVDISSLKKEKSINDDNKNFNSLS